jgi:phosphate-selective porin OprO/OprP
MGLEPLGGSEALTFMEYAAPIAAFTPVDRVGIQAKGSAGRKRFTWTMGFFSQSTNKEILDASSSIGQAIVRFTLLPWYEEQEDSLRLLHIGISCNYAYSGSEEIRYRSRPENHVAPYMIDTGTIVSDAAYLYGIEAAIVNGPFSVQAEYIQSFVEDDLGQNLTFKGLYASGSWLITGEHRPYDKSKGAFGRVTPKRNFSLKKKGLGAWEVALRFSHTNLNDGYVKGGKMNVWGAGVNWYLNSHLRLAFNYLHAYTHAQRTDPTKNGRANILTCRFDLTF